jgi:uncharacterized membrane protein
LNKMLQSETAILSPTCEFLSKGLKAVLKSVGLIVHKVLPSISCFAIFIFLIFSLHDASCVVSILSYQESPDVNNEVEI